jgi:hypothetical protein
MKRFFRLLKKNEKYWLSGLATLATFYLVAAISVAKIPVISAIALYSYVFVFPICLFYILWLYFLSK